VHISTDGRKKRAGILDKARQPQGTKKYFTMKFLEKDEKEPGVHVHAS